MLLVNLESNFDEQLAVLAKEHNKSKELFVKELIISFLEDKEDIAMATKAIENIKNGTSKVYTWEEVKEQNGL
jgi:predicted DNA-binding protein